VKKEAGFKRLLGAFGKIHVIGGLHSNRKSRVFY
jgi:hypothetical protein